MMASTSDFNACSITNFISRQYTHNDLAKRRALARPVEAEGRNELERLVRFRPILIHDVS